MEFENDFVYFVCMFMYFSLWVIDDDDIRNVCDDNDIDTASIGFEYICVHSK